MFPRVTYWLEACGAVRAAGALWSGALRSAVQGRRHHAAGDEPPPYIRRRLDLASSFSVKGRPPRRRRGALQTARLVLAIDPLGGARFRAPGGLPPEAALPP